MKKILKLGVFLLLLSVFVGCSDFMYAYKTVANDVKGIHLYTMNKVEAARDIMNNISFAR